jgi:Tfp pilus assembly protein PilN
MMLTVNLRPGGRRGRRVSPFAGLGDRVRAASGVVRDPLRVVGIAAWLGSLGFLGWTFFQTQAALGQLEPSLERALGEERRYQQFLQQKRREEATRDSILAQIRTIQRVDRDRYVWPRILDEVARALPPFTWLVEMTVAEADAVMQPDTAQGVVAVQIGGRTVDIQGYTRFMRQLEESLWLRSVTAVSANTVVEGGRAVTAFVLKALYTRPPDAEIPTVAVVATEAR